MMGKKIVSLFLLLVCLFSLSACSSMGSSMPYSSKESILQSSGAVDIQDHNAGMLYDKTHITLPDGDVYLWKAVYSGDKIFLFGQDDIQKNHFYLFDPKTQKIDTCPIEVDDFVVSICQSDQNTQLVLAIDGEGRNVLHCFSETEKPYQLILDVPDDITSDCIDDITSVGNHFVVSQNNSIYIYDKNGKLQKTIGDYSRFADCVLQNDGSVLICTDHSPSSFSTEVESQIVHLDENLNEIEQYDLNTHFSKYIRSNYPNSVYAFFGNTLYEFDFTTGKNVAYVDCFSSGMSANNLFILAKDFFFSIEQGAAFIWTPANGNSITTLTLATYNLNYTLQALVKDFNDKNANIKIQVIDYASFDLESSAQVGLTRLRADIIAGFTPDLYDLTNLPAEKYASIGILENLSPWFLAESEIQFSDFVPNIVNVLTNGEELYYITPGFTLLTVAGAQSFVGDRDSWTPEEFLSAANEISPLSIFASGMTRDLFLSYALLFNESNYIDKDSQSAHFEDSDFTQLLEFAKKLPKDSSDTDLTGWGNASLGEQMLLIDWLGKNAFKQVSYTDAVFSGTAKYVGFPSSTSSGIAIVPTALISVSASSQHKDAAKDFIFYLLSDECQGGTKMSDLPVIQESLNSKLKNWKEEYEQAPARLNALSHGGVVLIEGSMSSDQVICQIYDLINRADILAHIDDSLLEIVLRECQAYFEGGVTSEQTAKVIDSKVQIYLSEQYG